MLLDMWSYPCRGFAGLRESPRQTLDVRVVEGETGFSPGMLVPRDRRCGFRTGEGGSGKAGRGPEKPHRGRVASARQRQFATALRGSRPRLEMVS